VLGACQRLVFLAIEIGVLIRLFRAYDFHSNKNDRKASELKSELEEQKELSVDTLKYLGKMNVQMSIIKQVVEKFKAPVEKERIESVMNEMLQGIAGLVDNNKIGLRIINLENCKTISEVHLNNNGKLKKRMNRVPNKILCAELKRKKIQGIQVIPSEHSNFSLKTFVLIEALKVEKGQVVNKEQFDLVQDIVNQCEMIYLLCKSEYHK